MRQPDLAGRLERRVAPAAAWSRWLANFALILLFTAAGAHYFDLLETPAFVIVTGVAGALAVVALLCAAQAFRRVWNEGDLGGGDIVRGVALAVIVLAPFGYAGYLALTLPALTDISTDLDEPPALRAAAALRVGMMNPIAGYTDEQRRLQVEGYPDVTGRRYDLSAARVTGLVEQIVADNGWQEIDRRYDAGLAADTIELAARSPVLAFPADVAIRLTDEGDSTYVDMRSAWRYGPHDLGDNATRITTFLATLDTQAQALAGALPEEPVEGEEGDGEGADLDDFTPPTPEPRPEP